MLPVTYNKPYSKYSYSLLPKGLNFDPDLYDLDLYQMSCDLNHALSFYTVILSCHHYSSTYYNALTIGGYVKYAFL